MTDSLHKGWGIEHIIVGINFFDVTACLAPCDLGGDVLATRHEKGYHAQQAQHPYMMKWLIKSPLTKG